MTTTEETLVPRDRGEKWAPWATAALLALPTLVLRFPPMTDLPMHEAQVGAMLHFSDPRYFPPGLYQWNIGHPNQMFHLVAALLSFAVGSTWATKIVVALAQAGMVLAAARLADHLGVSRWTALLVSPLALGWTYLWGLIANMLGFVVLLAALPTFDRTNEKPTVRGALAGAGWMVLLYFAHESVMVIACGVVVLFAVGQPVTRHDLAKLALRIFPVIVAIAIFFGQQAVQKRMIDPAEVGEGGVEFNSPWSNVYGIPATLTGVSDIVINVALVLLVTIAILGFAAARWKTRAVQLDKSTSLRARIHQYRFELVAAFCALAYVFSPYGYAGGTMFNHRFFHPAYALFAITLAPQVLRRRPSRLQRILCVAVPVGFLLVVAPELVSANECARELDVLAERVELGSSLAYVEADPVPHDSFAPTPMAAHVLALRGGRMMFSFTYSVIAPVQIVRKYKWTESTNRLLFDTMLFSPQHDFHLFRYLLVHSQNPLYLQVTESLLPEAHLVQTCGTWSLYESNLPLVPLDSPDTKLPTPEPETLRHRMVERLRALAKSAGNPSLDPPAATTPAPAIAPVH